jgi:hypothetical protein
MQNNMIRSYKVISDSLTSDCEKDYQDIYNNVYTPDDILKVFKTLRDKVIDIISSTRSGRMYPWVNHLNGPRCGSMDGDHKIQCYGCMLLSRFSPNGVTKNKRFKVRLQRPYNMEDFIVITNEDTHFLGYEEVNPPDISSFDDEFTHMHKHYVTRDRHEHLTLISLLVDDDDISQLVYSYRCSRSTININRVYEYGKGTLNILANNEFTSYVGNNGDKYLNDDVLDGIIFQLHHVLSELAPNSYTHGRCTIDFLAFSDDQCTIYNTSYPFKLHIICSGYDTIVRNGIIYYYKPEIYDNALSYCETDSDKANFHRCHSGWNVDPGSADFYKFIRSLRSQDIFERTLHSRKDLLSLLDSENSWDLLESELLK